jgi:hypothetical protein
MALRPKYSRSNGDKGRLRIIVPDNAVLRRLQSEQCYNAQAEVDAESRLDMTEHVTTSEN